MDPISKVDRDRNENLNREVHYVLLKIFIIFL